MIRASTLIRALSIVVALVVVGTLLVPETASANRAQAERLRDQLNEINDQFSRAGAAFDKAFWALDETEKSIEDTNVRIAENETELVAAQDLLQARVAAWYRSDDLGVIPFLLGAQDFADLVTRVEYANRIARADAAVIERVESILAELHADRERLQKEQEERSEQVGKLKSERDELQQRLKEKRDEYDRVQRALAEVARREQEARQRSASARSGTPVAASSRGAMPAGPNGMVFPVAGPNYFSDTWGASRDGGRRRHMGTDIMAATGVPVVATMSGTLSRDNGSRSGLMLELRADNGWSFFYMHLDTITVGSGRVEAGQKIGTVGYSGNASANAPHLHYEIHLPGRGAVNPYPYLLQMQGR